MKLAVVGATGAVGTAILRILDERDLAISELVPVATARSAGRLITHRGRDLEVRAISREVFEGVEMALFDTPDEASAEWVPIAAASGAVVGDNSAAWRLAADVPLVVPEVNPEAVLDRPRGIIASPNCTMLTLVVPLAPLHRHAGLRRVIVSSYQSASGAGKAGIDELWAQVASAAGAKDAVVAGLGRDVLESGTVFPQPLAMNVVPRIGSVAASGYTGEEEKLRDETRKVLALPELPLTATCVRVPTVIGHGVAVHAEFEREVGADEARAILADAAGVELRDDAANGVMPTPLEAAGRDPVYVGRIRQDPHDRHTLEWFAVTDNLRKGAALNTVQIAELLVAREEGAR
ncbi:aspartate-semialdehyde dehydrogenase [soil metagenome]